MNNLFSEKLRISSLRGFLREGGIISGSPEIDELVATAESRRAQLDRPHFERLIQLINELTDRSDLTELIELLHPWRKGPFNLAGVEIDAEWRSDRKWDRIEPIISDLALEGRVVADIGCGNGYYMFRLLELAKRRGQMPAGIIGFDPSERFYFQFEFLSRFLGAPHCCYEVLGVEELVPFGGAFDLILFMGVLYHQRDPLAALRHVRSLLKPGGSAIIESIVIPGEGADCLRPTEGPTGRYAKMRNVYWLPTVPLLEATLRDAGFSAVRKVSCERTEASEQRRTQNMRFESLEDFLNPENPELTVEGYPRPLRAVFVAEK